MSALNDIVQACGCLMLAFAWRVHEMLLTQHAVRDQRIKKSMGGEETMQKTCFLDVAGAAYHRSIQMGYSRGELSRTQFSLPRLGLW